MPQLSTECVFSPNTRWHFARAPSLLSSPLANLRPVRMHAVPMTACAVPEVRHRIAHALLLQSRCVGHPVQGQRQRQQPLS